MALYSMFYANYIKINHPGMEAVDPELIIEMRSKDIDGSMFVDITPAYSINMAEYLSFVRSNILNTL